MKKNIILSIAVSVFFSEILNAQLNKDSLLGQVNTITTAVPLLLITPDSRAGALGDAGVASSPDANSIHWNASKLAFVEKKMGASISYTPWLRALVPDINLAYLSFYYKAKKKGTFASSLRYFSLGNITFTDIVGNQIGQFRPNEFAFDAAYALKLTDNYSMGGAVRYIYSNLTGGFSVQNATSKVGQSVAVDVSGYYQNDKLEIQGKKAKAAGGFNISNIGSKVSYTNTGIKDFIPINLRFGGSFTMDLDEYNSITFLGDINKLLVPTPPVYAADASGNPVRDPNTGEYVIAKGKNPDRSVVAGILGSFGDAPGGGKEELRELMYSTGIEYWYDKQFALRAGYFHEHATKGNRKYVTVGVGLKYNVFGLDFAYIIPTEQKHPLARTLRFTLLFDFDAFKEQEAPR